MPPRAAAHTARSRPSETRVTPLHTARHTTRNRLGEAASALKERLTLASSKISSAGSREAIPSAAQRGSGARAECPEVGLMPARARASHSASHSPAVSRGMRPAHASSASSVARARGSGADTISSPPQPAGGGAEAAAAGGSGQPGGRLCAPSMRWALRWAAQFAKPTAGRKNDDGPVLARGVQSPRGSARDVVVTQKEGSVQLIAHAPPSRAPARCPHAGGRAATSASARARPGTDSSWSPSSGS